MRDVLDKSPRQWSLVPEACVFVSGNRELYDTYIREHVLLASGYELHATTERAKDAKESTHTLMDQLKAEIVGHAMSGYCESPVANTKLTVYAHGTSDALEFAKATRITSLCWASRRLFVNVYDTIEAVDARDTFHVHVRNAYAGGQTVASLQELTRRENFEEDASLHHDWKHIKFGCNVHVATPVRPMLLKTPTGAVLFKVNVVVRFKHTVAKNEGSGFDYDIFPDAYVECATQSYRKRHTAFSLLSTLPDADIQNQLREGSYRPETLHPLFLTTLQNHHLTFQGAKGVDVSSSVDGSSLFATTWHILQTYVPALLTKREGVFYSGGADYDRVFSCLTMQFMYCSSGIPVLVNVIPGVYIWNRGRGTKTGRIQSTAHAFAYCQTWTT